jgi:hypothetical protein
MIQESDRLTYAELESRFPGEWVLVGDPELDEVGRVLSGIVVSHDADPDEMYRKSYTVDPETKVFASLCFREMPEGMAIVF